MKLGMTLNGSTNYGTEISTDKNSFNSLITLPMTEQTKTSENLI